MYRGEDVCDPRGGPTLTIPPSRVVCDHHHQISYENNLVQVDRHGPRHPQFRAEETRLLSFRDWPQALPQKPKELAEAGFFYLGRGDQVQCFYCDGGLKNWDPQDGPFEEHARWFGDCGFLRLYKGPEYVESIRKANPPTKESYEKEEAAVDVDHLAARAARKGDLSFSSSSPPLKKIHAESGYFSGESSQSSSLESTSDILDENSRLKEERLCKICRDKELGVVFIPCGHYATCVGCAPSFAKCPMCMGRIDKAVRTFLS